MPPGVERFLTLGLVQGPGYFFRRWPSLAQVQASLAAVDILSNPIRELVDAARLDALARDRAVLDIATDGFLSLDGAGDYGGDGRTTFLPARKPAKSGVGERARIRSHIGATARPDCFIAPSPPSRLLMCAWLQAMSASAGRAVPICVAGPVGM